MASLQIALGGVLTKIPKKIALGQQSSEVIILKGLSLIGIQTPAAFTGTALTFESCDDADGTNPVQVKAGAAGTAISYTVTVAGYYMIDPAQFAGIEFLRIKSGTVEVAERTLLISLKGQ